MTDKPTNCKDWIAIHNFQPIEPPKLRVTGRCTFPTPGFKVTFKHHVPQGINPLILLLDKIVTPPTGIEPQHVVTQEVKYEEKTSIRYTDVEILPDGVTIKVQNVE
ncbi:MAG TPA: hypothetical protein VJ723_02430 [Candidatus Angelobacter sp.]|nr:hypothetical protein [Candidatus Angelobacter sp.]